MNIRRYGFTMIELVWVIVVLGILAAIAIPRLAATRDDAQIAKGRSDVAAIRAAIVSERQGRLLQGQSNYINQLHSGSTGSKSSLFDTNGSSTLLQYGIATQNNVNGHWDDTVGGSAGAYTYVYRVMNSDNTFTYNDTNGTFRCTSGTYCGALTE
ncbi:prepilin-type N-terminal cleavage/methylation domain-containing protein [Sulfuricurvum sp. RIFCSPLOWO2_12_FULL_43_24]|uniref:prepilin-type N-terminal cleavage/methylation domain-containing protein n=1 Tax=Sulfuricurvum sp. RIFCSPLOWO2_12_FULL_43_24 TaxID=1802247 RepID=UPI0025E04CAC|nr:prepilin-type N-terminal cleavage/methylation domain-containing protein [Sulfuricurvum sp. RIFCSPLOWO2_12_FULL_43_24]